MSRYEATNDKGQQFSYGFDRPLREYFMQTWREPAKLNKHDLPEGIEPDDDPYWEGLVGSLSDTYGGHIELLTAINEHGVNIPQEHRSAIEGDLPF